MSTICASHVEIFVLDFFFSILLLFVLNSAVAPFSCYGPLFNQSAFNLRIA